MVKKNITISVDIEAYDEAKAKFYNLSKILNSALHDYINTHKSLDELKQEEGTQKEALEMKENEALAKELCKYIGNDKGLAFLYKTAIAGYRARGYSEERIKNIIDIAAALKKEVV